MPIKIEDISKKLGISVSTVSKSLNGYVDVSEKTRARVLEAAEEMGYHPNAAARNLRRRRTDNIGLVIDTPMHYVSESLVGLFPSMASTLENSDANLVLYTSAIMDPLKKLSKICQSREVDGLILFWADGIPEAIETLEKSSMKYIVMDSRVENPRASFVVKDNLQGSYELTNHLISLGHKRIGIMSRPIHGATNLDRLAGYKKALADADIKFEADLVVPTKVEPRSGYTEMLHFLDMDNPPQAVMAFHDLLAVNALEAIQDRGLRIPEDVAIAGFNNLNLRTSRRTTPALTTVGFAFQEMGRLVVESLFKLIEDKSAKPIRITIPTELIIRRSTDPLKELRKKNHDKKNL